MAYIRKYTDEMALKIIDENDNAVSLRQVSDGLGCTKLTADTLLKSMIYAKQIKRSNKGTDKKPFFIYSQVDKNV